MVIGRLYTPDFIFTVQLLLNRVFPCELLQFFQVAIYMGLNTHLGLTQYLQLENFVSGLAICCIVVTTPDIHSTTVSKNDKLNIDITAIDGVLKLVDKTRLNLELLLTTGLSESVQV